MKIHSGMDIQDEQEKYNLLVNTEFGYVLTPIPTPLCLSLWSQTSN